MRKFTTFEAIYQHCVNDSYQACTNWLFTTNFYPLLRPVCQPYQPWDPSRSSHCMMSMIKSWAVWVPQTLEVWENHQKKSCHGGIFQLITPGPGYQTCFCLTSNYALYIYIYYQFTLKHRVTLSKHTKSTFFGGVTYFGAPVRSLSHSFGGHWTIHPYSGHFWTFPNSKEVL